MAGRPKKPTVLKLLTGQHKKDPGRFKGIENEPKPVRQVGRPPTFFTKPQKKIWNEVKKHCHDGLLCSADRFALERICILIDKERIGEATATEGKALDSLLVQFGMTPSARTRVVISKPEEKKGFGSIS